MYSPNNNNKKKKSFDENKDYIINRESESSNFSTQKKSLENKFFDHSEDILNYDTYNTNQNQINSKENENNLLRTAHFNSLHEPITNNQVDELSYIKEMEENMRLFDLKLKKLENQTSKTPTKPKEIKSFYLNRTHNNLAKNDDYSVRNNYNRNKSPDACLIIDNFSLNKKKEEVEWKNSKSLFKEISSSKSPLKEKNSCKNDKSEIYFNELEILKEENFVKDQQIKNGNEEFRNLRNYIENLKSENTKLKNILNKKEEDLLHFRLKINELENQKVKVENKNSSDENKLKNLKNEYINMTKNFQLQKKQVESLTNKLEEIKAENYNLQQENSNLKKKFAQIEKKSKSNYNSNLDNGKENLDKFDIKKYFSENKILDENFFPSEMRYVENKNEFAFYEEKLSALLKHKLLTENEIFKLPDKPRTLNEINKKKEIEGNLTKIENQIADVRSKLRRLNGKNN